MSCSTAAHQLLMSCSTATAQQLSELQHSNSTAVFRASELQHSNSTAAFRASAQQPSELQHSSLQNCSTAAFRAAAQQPSDAPKTAPDTLGVLQSHARAVLQALCSPYDCRPYGLQPSKLTDPQSTEFYPMS